MEAVAAAAARGGADAVFALVAQADAAAYGGGIAAASLH